MHKDSFFYKYKSIVAFLILEVLALVSFTFGNINEILFLVSSVLSICGFIFAFATNVDKKDYLRLLPMVVVMFIVSGIAAFGGFSHSFSTLSNVATFLAIPSFFALGFFIRRLGEVKIEHVLLAVGFGFAAITLISTFATWINYGFFYSLIYKIKGTTNYYYNGTPYNVTEEMSWLVGFSFKEVSIQYGGLFAIVSAAYLPALLFISPKKEKNYFISVATIGGIGLISLISIPNFKALIVLVIASIFVFVYKYLKSKKLVTSILGYAFVAIIGLGVLFFFIAMINAAAGFKFTGFLERIFVKNGIMQKPSEVLMAAFDKTETGTLYNLFGFDLRYSQRAAVIGLESIIRSNTGIFEIQIIKEIGAIGAVVFILFLVAMIYFLINYVKEDNDAPAVKSILVVVLIAFFAYSSLYNDIMPLTHDQSNYIAFLRSAPLMVMLFFLGLTYFRPKEVKFNLVEEGQK